MNDEMSALESILKHYEPYKSMRDMFDRVYYGFPEEEKKVSGNRKLPVQMRGAKEGRK